MKESTQKRRVEFLHEGQEIILIIDPYRKVLEFRKKYRRKFKSLTFSEAYLHAIGQLTLKL